MRVSRCLTSGSIPPTVRRTRGRAQAMEMLESRLLLTGAAAELIYVAQPGGGTTRTGLGTITVSVDDSLGNRILTDHSKVALAVESPAGVTIGGSPVAFAKHGLATFKNVKLTTAGTYALIATDGALAPAVSQSFTVKAAATQLVILKQPVGGTSGSVFTVQFKLEDAAGNVVTTDNTPVSLKIATGSKGAKLSGTTTVTAVNGVATFSNVSLPKAGSYSLIGVDQGLKSVGTNVFTMAVGAAARLRIASVAGTGSASRALKHGVVGPVTVDVVDAFGNVVTTDASTVTLVLDTTLSTEVKLGTVTQAQTGTAVAAGGVAVFSALTTEPTGWYQCVVTDGSLSGDERLLFVR